MTVTAVPATELKQAGIVTFKDLDQVVVGVKLGNTGIFSEPSVRGITSFLTAAGADSNVSLYIDGFYQSDPLTFAQDLVNLEDIQVLKGPQGTLYGRNSTGGAILVRTLEPSDHFTGNFLAGYGNLNEAKGQAYIAGPIMPGLDFSLTGAFRNNDGYIKGISPPIGMGGSTYDAAPFKSNQFQGKLRWKPTDDLTLEASYRHSYFSDATGNSYNLYNNLMPVLLNQPRSTTRDETIESIISVFNSKTDTYYGKLQWNNEFGTLGVYSQYQKSRNHQVADDDRTLLDLSRVGSEFGRTNYDNTIEYTLTAIDRLNVIIGANYYNDSATGTGFSYSGADPVTGVLRPVPQIFSLSSYLDTKAYAFYLDGTYELIDRLYVSAGVRYTEEKRTFNSSLFANGFRLGTGTPQTAKFYDGTPRATLRYEIAKATNVYFAYSQGFKAGTYNTSSSPLGPPPPPVLPEKATNYEIGFKTVQQNWRLEAAVYYTKYKDLQVSAIVRNAQGILGTQVQNAAKATNYGAEVNITYQVNPDFNLRAGLGYTHARYDSFPNAAVTLLDRRPTIIVGGRVVPNPNYLVANLTGQTEDFTGLRLERAPDWTANIGGDYTYHVGDGRLIVSGNISYASEYAPTTDAYDPTTGQALHVQPGYAIVNAQATYEFADGRTTASVWGKNILNKRYLTADTDSTWGSYKMWAPPVTYGFTVGYRF
jgi:iron complex outermembrane receptor protein